MNRPEKKNALTSAMYDAMAEAIETASGSSPIRCVLIAGVPGAFSAGNDLGDFMKAAMGGEGLGNSVLRFLYSLARAERPLVAAVQGVAVGIGTTMMLPLRLRGRGERCALLHAVRGARTCAGGGLKPDRAARHGTSPRIRAARDGQAFERRGGESLRPRQSGRACGPSRGRGDEGRASDCRAAGRRAWRFRAA